MQKYLTAALMTVLACSSPLLADDDAPHQQVASAQHGNKVASVELSVDSLPLTPGDSGKITCTPKNQRGATLTNACTWSSGNTSVATVSSQSAQVGRVLAKAAGRTQVTATVTGTMVMKSAWVPVTDTAVVVPPDTTPTPPSACDTATTALLFGGGFEGTPPPFPRMTNQARNWQGFELSQVGSYPYSFTQVSNPARECGAAVRFELHRADSNIAGQKRGQIINLYAGHGGVALPSGQSFGGGLGQERWIGFSVYVPNDWTFETGYAPDGIFELLEAARTPSLFLEISGNQWNVVNQTGHGLNGDPSWVSQYVSTPVTRGAWTDWVFHVVWSGGTTGVLQVWKNGANVVNKVGSWTAYTDMGSTKPTWGIYKWSWNGTLTGGASIVTTRNLLLDAIRITDGAHGSYAMVAPRGARP